MFLFNSVGSFAMLLATRRASSIVSTLAVSALARIDIGERLAARVLHDIAPRNAFGGPRRLEAARHYRQ